MSNYHIGIGALDAVQKALDVVGNNIANAATEGYHKQRIDLRPAPSMKAGTIVFGTGVKVADVTRLVDRLMEEELLRQRSLLEHSDTEVSILKTIESVLGEMSTEAGGLNAAMDAFFNALQDLSAHPRDPVYQHQVVNEADSMAGQFRTVGEYLTALETEIGMEADNVADAINSLSSQIAQLNDDIERVEVLGGTANSMRDERDQLITDLGKKVRVETIQRDFGVVDVSISGMPLIMGSSTVSMTAGYDDSGDLGLAATGSSNYLTQIDGGRMGGLLSLRNDLIDDLHDDLDSLAAAIIDQINQLHVQGVGSSGSFTSLSGRTMTSEALSDWGSSVADGSFFVRLTNMNTGTVSRHEIQIDASADTLTTVAADLSAISGLSASVTASKLNILADTNYQFDFLPSVLSSPTASNLTGSSPPTVGVSGIYTGSSNQTLTFTVSGTGSVGNGTLQLSVTDGDGDALATLGVGSGYAAGDELAVGNGVKITLSRGDLVSGDTFEVDVYGDTDTSGFLSAAGLNTLFSGSHAEDIAVCTDMVQSPSRVAAALGSDMTDNTNASRMAELRSQTLTALGSLTCGDYYRQVITDLGQQVSLKQMRQDNIEAVVQNLSDHQSDMSGVDINEEAAQLLVFEQMFQSIAKYLSTVRGTMAQVMEII